MHAEAPEEVCSLLLHWKWKVVTFLSISCPTSTITADHEWLCVFYSCHLGDDNPVPLLPYILGSLLSAFINYSMQIETRRLYTAGGFLSLTLPLNSQGPGSKQRALHITSLAAPEAKWKHPWPESLRAVLLPLGLWPKADVFDQKCFKVRAATSGLSSWGISSAHFSK